MHSYVLYANGDICIMAKINHKGALREAGDIGK